MVGPIHVFHQSAHERDALERDLRSVEFDVRTFDSGKALIAVNDRIQPALVLWDMDVGRVRGGLAHLAQSLGCPVVGLTSNDRRPREDERSQTVLLPFERWRVTPLVLRVLSAAESGGGVPAAEGVVSTIRVLADTVRQSIFDGLDQFEASHGAPPQRAEGMSPVAPARSATPAYEVPPLPATRSMTQTPPPLPLAVPAPVPAAAPAATKVRVLLADDDEVLQHILGYQLECAGWVVVRTADGVEAQRILEAGGVDVLLVDLNLPHKNGFEILERLHPDVNLPKLRVVVLSEQVQEDKIVRAFNLGAHDFVQKPLNPRVVVSRIARLLRSE